MAALRGHRYGQGSKVKRITIRVHGRVQRVFFRRSAQFHSLTLGLTGLARNEEDGSVTIVAEGEQEKLEHLLEWCKKGPPLANVTGVVTEWQAATEEFKRFKIQ